MATFDLPTCLWVPIIPTEIHAPSDEIWKWTNTAMPTTVRESGDPPYWLVAHAMVSEAEEVVINDRLDQITSGHNTDVHHGKLLHYMPPVNPETFSEAAQWQTYLNRVNRSLYWWGDAFVVQSDWTTHVKANDIHSRPNGETLHIERREYFTPAPGAVFERFITGTARCDDLDSGNPTWSCSCSVTVNWCSDPIPQRIDRDHPMRIYQGTDGHSWTTTTPPSYETLYAACPADPAGTRRLNYTPWYNLTPYYDGSNTPNTSFQAFNEVACVKGISCWPDEILRGMQDAFIQASDNFPKYADNNIANALEIFDLCKDILLGKWTDAIPKTLAELWLFWRYAVTTTASDVRQARDAIKRRQVTYLKPYRTHGIAHVEPRGRIGTSSVTIRCSYDAVLNASDMLAMLQYRLHQAGLEITGYTLWDLVPFSFMVDWFMPVGDRLELRDKIRHLERDYVITNCNFSMKYTQEWETGKTQHYTRWYQNPPSLDNYILNSGDSSRVTTRLKRVGDVMAMVASI